MSAPELHKPDCPPAKSPKKEPWPMWPIILAILLFIPVYTWINIDYRKDGGAFEPNQALKDRQNEVIDKNFYDWYRLEPSEDQSNTPLTNQGVTVQAIEGPLEDFLPEELVYYIPRRPVLAPEISDLQVSASISNETAYIVSFSVPRLLAESGKLKLKAFYKENDLFLLVDIYVEHATDATPLLTGPSATIRRSIPTDPIESDSLNVHLLTESRLHKWTATSTDSSATE